MNIVSPKTMWLIIALEAIASFFVFDWEYVYEPGIIACVFFLIAVVFWIVIISFSLLVNRRAHKNAYATQKIVTTGIYEYMRHPMYSASVLLFLSVAIRFPAPWIISSAFMGIIILFWFMGVEDGILQERFKKSFSLYKPSLAFWKKKQTKRKRAHIKKVVKQKKNESVQSENGEELNNV